MIVPAVRKLDLAEIPMIDVAPLVAGNETLIPETVAAIARAAEGSGFLYVRNHGVPSALLADLIHQCERFFALPLAERMAVAAERSPQFRGYLPLEYGGKRTGQKKGPNLQEAFLIGPERPCGPVPLDGPNQWPAGLSELKVAMTAYFDATEAFGRKMLKGFARALGQHPDFFDQNYRSPMLMMKLNHYPPQPPMTDGQKIGVSGHSDADDFTILWQDSLGGLELLNKHGDWVQVPPIEGTYVINIGDMMERWSGGRFVSTRHRVVNTSGAERYSIPLFMAPHYHTVVRPLDGDAGKSMVAGEYLLDRWQTIYPQGKADASA